MVDNNRHVKFNLRGARRGDYFRIGFNQIGNALERRADPEMAVFVEISNLGGPSASDAYGALSVDEAKQIIAKLQEVVDHYENFRPIDALGLGAVVERTGFDDTFTKLYVNIGGYWEGTTGMGTGTAAHMVVNDWLKDGTAVVRHEGYKGGDK